MTFQRVENNLWRIYVSGKNPMVGRFDGKNPMVGRFNGKLDKI